MKSLLAVPAQEIAEKKAAYERERDQRREHRARPA
jgi:hypothetical protein